MSGGTYKPCHGCGEKGWRHVDRLCDKCAELLSLGKAVKMDAEYQSDSKEETLFRLVPDWPHFFVHDDETRRELVEAFQELTRRVLRPSKSHRDAYAKDVSPLPTESRGRTYFTTFYRKALVYRGPAVTGKAIDRLDLAVRAALRSQREDGIAHGGDLLGQLARGEITVKKLNEETMKGEA